MVIHDGFGSDRLSSIAGEQRNPHLMAIASKSARRRHAASSISPATEEQMRIMRPALVKLGLMAEGQTK